MPVPVIASMVIGLLVLGGCGGPIPSVRAGAEPEGQFVRVKSATQAQAEEAHAQNLRREHAEAPEAALTASGSTHPPAATRPASEPAASAPVPEELASPPSSGLSPDQPPETPVAPEAP